MLFRSKEYLYFRHQSFQEYLAAEYIAKEPEKLMDILDDSLNPKWKNVLMFLAGQPERGNEIVERILSKEDAHHRNIFLSAELFPEVIGVKSCLKEKLLDILYSLVYDKKNPFRYIVIQNMIHVDREIAMREIEVLLHSDDDDEVINGIWIA